MSDAAQGKRAGAGDSPARREPWFEALGRLLCRLGFHDWRICSVDLAGHQSSRSRRCDRCFDNGRLLIEKQARGYYGGSIGDPWKVETDERGSVVDGRFTRAAHSQKGSVARVSERERSEVTELGSGASAPHETRPRHRAEVSQSRSAGE